MDILQATERYEGWLASKTPLIERDLRWKHREMRKHAFAFLRATFYRWAQQWPATCRALRSGPVVLSVGDLHVENFGTWRDAEGRLIWGVNDFDEAYWLPMAHDLVRLATSAQLADGIRLSHRAVARAIVRGYRRGLERGGQPYVLGESHTELRALALSRLKNPEKYWRKLCRWPEAEQPIPPGARSGVEELMPAPDLPWRIVHRRAGRGSLGRPRLHGDRLLGGRQDRAGGQGARALGLGLGIGRGGAAAASASADPGAGGAVPGSVRADSRPLDPSPPGARLLSHRAGIAGRRTGSAPAPPGDGRRDGQHPSGEREGRAAPTVCGQAPGIVAPDAASEMAEVVRADWKRFRGAAAE